jgi:hypothetical protein
MHALGMFVSMTTSGMRRVKFFAMYVATSRRSLVERRGSTSTRPRRQAVRTSIGDRAPGSRNAERGIIGHIPANYLPNLPNLPLDGEEPSTMYASATHGRAIVESGQHVIAGTDYYWVLVLNRYQRDNLLALINAAGWDSRGTHRRPGAHEHRTTAFRRAGNRSPVDPGSAFQSRRWVRKRALRTANRTTAHRVTRRSARGMQVGALLLALRGHRHPFLTRQPQVHENADIPDP